MSSKTNRTPCSGPHTRDAPPALAPRGTPQALGGRTQLRPPSPASEGPALCPHRSPRRSLNCKGPGWSQLPEGVTSPAPRPPAPANCSPRRGRGSMGPHSAWREAGCGTAPTASPPAAFHASRLGLRARALGVAAWGAPGSHGRSLTALKLAACSLLSVPALQHLCPHSGRPPPLPGSGSRHSSVLYNPRGVCPHCWVVG